jgi:hypothetical protein
MDKATIGHNNPPPDARVEVATIIKNLQDRAANLLAAYPEFKSDSALEVAGEMKRELEKAAKTAEAARKKEKQPHDDAGKEVQTYWLPLIARMDAAAKDIGGKMQAELSRRKSVKDAEERAAQEEARRLADEAEMASKAAFAALDAVSNGEAVDGNHLEARAAAEDAHAAAEAAAEKAAQIAKTSAGVKVAGASAVHIKTVRKVRLAFPRTGTRAQRAAAVLDFMECIAGTSSGAEMTETMVRLANQVYRIMKVVPPHCEEYDEEKVV